MTTRFATSEEIAQWDELLAGNPDGGNVFQAREMAETKRANGWTPRYVICEGLAITALEKKVFAHGALWYLPKGPGVSTPSQLTEVVAQLRVFAAKHGVFAVKIEPELLENADEGKFLADMGLVKTTPVQPNASTVILNLSPSLDEIMTSLPQKGRHAIRRAERDGVRAMPVDLSEDNMQTMFALLSDTAAGRFESSLRSFAYYKTFWQSFVETGKGQLFFAYLGSDVVAAAYCMYLGKKGLYKDGASVRERSAYGASHLLQWEIIRWMKQRGVTSYDLCGAPHSASINDETHKFYGVGRFKTSFNKQVTDYVGCYDLVVNPRAYRRWQRFMQRLVISLSWRLKKRQWL